MHIQRGDTTYALMASSRLMKHLRYGHNTYWPQKFACLSILGFIKNQLFEFLYESILCLLHSLFGQIFINNQLACELNDRLKDSIQEVVQFKEEVERCRQFLARCQLKNPKLCSLIHRDLLPLDVINHLREFTQVSAVLFVPWFIFVQFTKTVCFDYTPPLPPEQRLGHFNYL